MGTSDRDHCHRKVVRRLVRYSGRSPFPRRRE
jgi:hypothetical protein